MLRVGCPHADGGGQRERAGREGETHAGGPDLRHHDPGPLGAAGLARGAPGDARRDGVFVVAVAGIATSRTARIASVRMKAPRTLNSKSYTEGVPVNMNAPDVQRACHRSRSCA